MPKYFFSYKVLFSNGEIVEGDGSFHHYDNDMDAHKVALDIAQSRALSDKDKELVHVNFPVELTSFSKVIRTNGR